MSLHDVFTKFIAMSHCAPTQPFWDFIDAGYGNIQSKMSRAFARNSGDLICTLNLSWTDEMDAGERLFSRKRKSNGQHYTKCAKKREKTRKQAERIAYLPNQLPIGALEFAILTCTPTKIYRRSLEFLHRIQTILYTLYFFFFSSFSLFFSAPRHIKKNSY